MTISEHSSRHSGPVPSVRARNVSFDEDRLVVDLDDGRTIVVPIAWFPRLAEAVRIGRRDTTDWRLIGGGIGIHWPGFDEDISVENLLATRDELLHYRPT